MMVIKKNRWKKCLITVGLVALSGILYAQPLSLPNKEIIFDQLPLELGLSQNSINCILQDSKGFLWIGTWSGLIRYDGYSSVVYHADNGLDKIKSDKITAIYEDHNGYLWVGTQMAGLFRFDRNTEKFLQYKHNASEKNSLSNNNVWCIKEDSQRQLWVGTESGVNIFDRAKNKFSVFHSTPDSLSISDDHITDMLLSSRNEFWIATARGVNLVNAQPGHSYTFKRYYYGQDSISFHSHNYFTRIEELMYQGKSSIWFCTPKGLKKCQEGVIQNFLAHGKPSSYNTILSILIIHGPHPYIIAGSEKGLNFFDPVSNTFTKFLSVFDERVNLSHAAVTALYLDKGGVLWAGTKKGLNKFDSYSKNFEAYKTSSFDKSRSIITGIQRSVEKGFWISTIGGGLYRFNDKNFQSVRINDHQGNDLVNFIQTLYTSRNGDVWLGTAGEGVYRFQEKDFNKTTGLINQFDHFNTNTNPSLTADFIMSITEDNLGNVWLGTWQSGLNKISPDGRVMKFIDPLLTQVPLVIIYADRTGTLWIGTRGNGLYKVKQSGNELDIRRLHSTDKRRGNLTNNFINSICEDHNGLLWLGTEGGLHSFDPRTEIFKSLQLKGEPGANVIASVQEDNNGKLWLASQDGLTVVDPEDAQYVKKYDYHDRIQGGFFYNNVSYKDETGRLLFGGSEGFNIIEPDVVVQNPNVPKVTISNLQIFGKSVRYGNEIQGRTILHKPLSETDQITLKSKENSISFEFTALDYAAPEKIRYAYMLKGFDADWNYTDFKRRYAVYTNLSEGTYIFSVKAANSDGIWTEQVNQLKVVIDPPWWKTGWAMFVYGLVLLLSLYFFRRLILISANFRHDLKVERLQRENMEKLNQAKLQFFTNISHEFRTPLTLILGPAQNLLDGRERDKEERNQLLSINNNANRLLRLVNQLLDFRKVESGNLKLKVSEGNIVKFMREIKLSFDGLAENLKIDFSFMSSSHVTMVWFDSDQFEKIMFNLLSNAFKHTPEGGKIELRVIEEKEEVVIVVEDNGTGIKREHFENIFQTFFSYDEDKHHTGTGIGLAFTKSLVDMHHGQLKFESEERVFTRFLVTLPLGSSHFDVSELSPISNDVESMDYYPSLSTAVNQLEQDLENYEIIDEAPKLLIVEDNDEVRAYIKSIFKDRYHILQAVNGQEGLTVALGIMPDIIISDVMMPVMDGIKFCTQLKSDVKTSHIPIILLTARTSLIFKVEGLETGADDYITKPFNPNVLKLKVRNLIHTREVMQKMFQDNTTIKIEPSKVTLTSTDEIFIKHALEGVERNMSNPDYSVDDLGKDVGMSRTQLYRKLKALTGQSANEFIRSLRLKRAAQLLEQNQLTIAEVTNSVGFTDLQYFRDCFKKLFGVIPSGYSKNRVEEMNKKK